MAEQSTQPEEEEAGPEDVKCDFCITKKLRAVKSCQVCLASYCTTHLQPHYMSDAFKRHKIVDVSASLQDMVCPKHDKLLEVYCRTDGECLCLLCVMDEHKNHDTVSAAAERKQKQKLFGKKKQSFQQGIQEREKQLEQLRHRVKAMQCSGAAGVEQSEKASAEIVLMVDKWSSAMKERIRVQETAVVSRTEELMERVEREISELREREDELKQLSLTEDHIHFLRNCRPILDLPEPATVDYNIHLQTPFDFVTKAISDLTEKQEDMVKAITDLSETVQAGSDPTTRQEFYIYSCHLTLDPNTAFEKLLLSEGNSTVTGIKKSQNYPNHPERFTKYDQVLCTEGLTGVCYWEVEWRGPRVEVAVCYKRPELEENSFGYSDQSWCISLSNTGCKFWHCEKSTPIPTSCSSTVGVYVNHRAGRLSFYSVSDLGEMILLHRVQTTFSQPLYPGFMVARGATVRIMSLKKKESSVSVA